MKTKTLSSNGNISLSDAIVKCNCLANITARLDSSKNFTKEVIIKKVDSSANTVTILPARREFLEDATLQVETATVAGTVTGAGNATVVVTAAGFTAITLSVAVDEGDTASIVARKIRAALTAHAQIGDYNTGAYDVSGSGATVVLTQIDPTGNDSTLNISIDNGTCTGLTTAATSVKTTAGVAVTLSKRNDTKILAPTENGWVIVGEVGVPLYVLTVNGVTKLRNRPTTDEYAVEIKSEFTDTDAAHYCVPITCDWKPSGTATAGGVQALQGTSRLAATHTMTGGSIIGTYGQACNDGTLNGAGIMMAGLYGLIEDGGTYTAVSHVAAAWLDSHLDQAVTAGEVELLYMSNNGDTTFDQAIYVYAGNKITNLFNINTASGMVSANTEAATTLTFTNWKLIKIVLDGTTHYIPVAQTIAATT